LNAVLNVLSDSEPSDSAIADTGSLQCVGRSPASSMRLGVIHDLDRRVTQRLNEFSVMAGLVPAIHVFLAEDK
jgi:hypothetical protein